MPTHPSEPTGALSGKGRPDAVPTVGTDFGAAAGLTSAALESGLALVGPEDARRRVIVDLMRQASEAGEGFCVVSLGRTSALCDAAHALASGTGDTARVRTVDTEVPDGRSHVLDPFAGVDATGLERILLSASQSLGGASPVAARGRRLLAAIVAAGTEMRDADEAELSALFVRSNATIGQFESLGYEGRQPGLSEATRRAVRGYVHDIPGRRLSGSGANAFDHHAPAQDLVLDAVTWLGQDRYRAIAGGEESDLSVADLASGLQVVLRTLPRHGEDKAAAFLVACLEQSLRRRKDAAPLLVVVDGVHELTAPEAKRLDGLLGAGVRLVLGCSGIPDEPHAMSLREMAWKAVLPGSGRVAGALGLPDTIDRDVAYGIPVLARGDAFIQVDLPAVIDHPPHGAVERHPRTWTEDAPAVPDTLTLQVRSRLLHPELGDIAGRYAAGIPASPAAKAIEMGLAGCDVGGVQLQVAACKSVALAALARSGR